MLEICSRKYISATRCYLSNSIVFQRNDALTYPNNYLYAVVHYVIWHVLSGWSGSYAIM